MALLEMLLGRRLPVPAAPSWSFYTIISFKNKIFFIGANCALNHNVTSLPTIIGKNKRNKATRSEARKPKKT